MTSVCPCPPASHKQVLHAETVFLGPELKYHLVIAVPSATAWKTRPAHEVWAVLHNKTKEFLGFFDYDRVAASKSREAVFVPRNGKFAAPRELLHHQAPCDVWIVSKVLVEACKVYPYVASTAVVESKKHLLPAPRSVQMRHTGTASLYLTFPAFDNVPIKSLDTWADARFAMLSSYANALQAAEQDDEMDYDTLARWTTQFVQSAGFEEGGSIGDLYSHFLMRLAVRNTRDHAAQEWFVKSESELLRWRLLYQVGHGDGLLRLLVQQLPEAKRVNLEAATPPNRQTFFRLCVKEPSMVADIAVAVKDRHSGAHFSVTFPCAGADDYEAKRYLACHTGDGEATRYFAFVAGDQYVHRYHLTCVDASPVPGVTVRPIVKVEPPAPSKDFNGMRLPFDGAAAAPDALYEWVECKDGRVVVGIDALPAIGAFALKTTLNAWFDKAVAAGTTYVPRKLQPTVQRLQVDIERLFAKRKANVEKQKEELKALLPVDIEELGAVLPACMECKHSAMHKGAGVKFKEGRSRYISQLIHLGYSPQSIESHLARSYDAKKMSGELVHAVAALVTKARPVAACKRLQALGFCPHVSSGGLDHVTARARCAAAIEDKSRTTVSHPEQYIAARARVLKNRPPVSVAMDLSGDGKP